MAALRTEQLEFLLDHLVQRPGVVDSLGVFPADCIPRRLSRRRRDACFILNTEPLGRPGAHWLAFYHSASTPTRLEYFDSFGGSISLYRDVVAAIAVRNPDLTVQSANNSVLQALTSTACGYYCLYFLCLRAKSSHTSSGCFRISKPSVVVSAADRIKRLSRSAIGRDAEVVRFVHHAMHQSKCVDAFSNVECTTQSQFCVSYT